jgi:hypothetical protein
MVDRTYWEQRGSRPAMRLVDQLLVLVREATGDKGLAPKYNQGYIGVARGGFGTNFFLLRPRQDDMVFVALRIPRTQETSKNLDAAGIVVTNYDPRWGAYSIRFGEAELTNSRALLTHLIRQAYDAQAG